MSCFPFGKKSKANNVPALRDDDDTAPQAPRAPQPEVVQSLPTGAAPPAQAAGPLKVSTIPPVNTVDGDAEREDDTFLEGKDLDYELVTILNELSAGEGRVDIKDTVKQVRQRNGQFGPTWRIAVDEERCDTALMKICKDSLSYSLPSIKKLVISPSGFPHALFLAQFAAKIITTLYLGCRGQGIKHVYAEGDSFEDCKKSWLKEVRRMRRDMKSSSKLKNAKVPLGAVNFALTQVEIGVLALKDPEQMMQFLKNAAGLFKGLAESVATFSLKPDVFKYALKLGKQAADKAAQIQADRCFCFFSSFEVRTHQMQILLQRKGPGGNEIKEVKSILKALQAQILGECRWEIVAAFIDVLGRVLLGERVAGPRSIQDLDPSFTLWVIRGEAEDGALSKSDFRGQFLGLQGLASIGEDPALRERMESGSDVPLVVLDQWGANVLESMKKMAVERSVVEDGVSLAQTEIDSGLEGVRESVRLASTSGQQIAKEDVLSGTELSLRTAKHRWTEIKAIKTANNGKLVKAPTLKPSGSVRPGQTAAGVVQADVDSDRIIMQLDALKSRLKKSRHSSDALGKLVKQVTGPLHGATLVAETMAGFFGAFGSEKRMQACVQDVEGRFREAMAQADAQHAELSHIMQFVVGSTQQWKVWVRETVQRGITWQHASTIVGPEPGFLGGAVEGDKMLHGKVMEKAEALVQSCQSALLAARQLEQLEVRATKKKTKDDSQLAAEDKEVHETAVKLRALTLSQQSLLPSLCKSIEELRRQFDGEDSPEAQAALASENALYAQRFETLTDTMIKVVSDLLQKTAPPTAESSSGGAWRSQVESKFTGKSTSVDKSVLKEELLSGSSQQLMKPLFVFGAVSARFHLLVRSLKGLNTRLNEISKQLEASNSSVRDAPKKTQKLLDKVREYLTSSTTDDRGAGVDDGSGSFKRKDPKQAMEEDIEKLFADVEGMLGYTEVEGVDGSKERLVNSLSRLWAMSESFLLHCDGAFRDCTDLRKDLVKCGLSRLDFGALEQFHSAEEVKAAWEEISKAGGRLKDWKDEVMMTMEKHVGKAFSDTLSDVKGTLDDFSLDIYDPLEDESGVLKTAVEFAKGLKAMMAGGKSRNKQELWRARDRAVFQLMSVAAALKQPTTRAMGEDERAVEAREASRVQSLKAVEAIVLRRKVLEQVPGVQKTLGCTTFFSHLENIIQESLEDNQEKLEAEIKDRMKVVEEMHEKLLAETNPVKKQLGTVALAKERKALVAIVGNLSDMSKAFPVVLSFLTQIQDQLNEISNKLDALAEDVKEIRQDLRRLAGLPAMQSLEKYREDLIVRGQDYDNAVYIRPHCHDSKTLLIDKVANFFQDPLKGVLLISGQAGSGKSVFAAKLEQWILGEHYSERKAKDNKTVVLVWANLPALKNPMTALFEEALQLKYHFRPNQVHELREKIQDPDSNVEVVFVLDGYDELHPQFLFRNLFKSNNLESYRRKIDEKDKENTTNKKNELYSQPKVVIFCRKELLANNPDYQISFLPIESLNEHKDEPIEAVEYFDQVEIGLFDEGKFKEYVQAYVALNVRQAFEGLFSKLRAKPDSWNSDDVLKIIRKVFDLPEVVKEIVDKKEQRAKVTGVVWKEDETDSDNASETSESGVSEISSFDLEFAYQDDDDDDDALDESIATELQEVANKLKQYITQAQGEQDADDAEKWTSELCLQLQALAKTLSAPFIKADKDKEKSMEELQGVAKAVKRELVAARQTVKPEEDSSFGFRMMAEFLFSVLSGKGEVKDKQAKVKQFLQEVQEKRIWTVEMTMHEFEAIPELKALTTTPFMIQIVVQILPILKEMRATVSGVKQEIMLRTNEEIAERAWAGLRKYELVSSDKDLERTQELLELDANALLDKLKAENEKGAKAETSEKIREVEKSYTEMKAKLKKIISVVAKQSVEHTAGDFLDKEELKQQTAEVAQQLTRALKRKPVRRYLIYNEFIAHWISREAFKAISKASALSPDQLRKEVWDYSERLACKMTADAMTKINYIPGSIVFSKSDQDEWHPFFGIGDEIAEHRALVRRAAPLKEQSGLFSFIHKSVQEFLVAKAICESVDALISQTMLAPTELQALIDAIRMPANDEPVNRQVKFMDGGDALPLGAGAHASDEFQSAQGQATMQRIINALGSNMPFGERKRKAKGVLRLIQGLARGPLNEIELSGEEAVRDFLVDALLDDIKVSAGFAAVATLCLTQHLHEGVLDHVLDNLQALFTMQMPKRDGNTLVHAACMEENNKALAMVIDFCKDPAARTSQEELDKLLLAPNSKGSTPLALAAATSNWELCKRLLSTCSDRERMLEDCEKLDLKIQTLVGSRDEKFFTYGSAEAGALKEGRVFFEVELDLTKLRIAETKDCKPFGGTICVGLASGTRPKSQTIVERNNAERTGDNYSKLWKKAEKENNKERKKVYARLVKQRLRSCPMVSKGMGDVSYPSVAGIALHVVQSYENVGRYRTNEVDLYCERLEMGWTAGDEQPEEEEGDALLPIDRNRYIDIFTTKKEAPPGTSPAGKGAQSPGLSRTESGLKRQGSMTPGSAGSRTPLGRQDSASYRVQVKPKTVDMQGRDRRAWLGVAIDMVDEEFVEIQCCWTTAHSAGTWQRVDLVPKSVFGKTGMFPVVCAWRVKAKPVVNFGYTKFRNKPPELQSNQGPPFMPYITAAQGTSAHTIAARNEDWDIAFKLLEESSRGPAELLAQYNRSSGETLLHYFVQRGTTRLNAVKTLLDKSRELEKQGTEGAVRKVLLAKDMKGFCAYSLVNNDQMSSLIMENYVDNDKDKLEMLKDVVDRVYLELQQKQKKWYDDNELEDRDKKEAKIERKEFHKRFKLVEGMMDDDANICAVMREHIVALVRRATRDNQNFISFLFFTGENNDLERDYELKEVVAEAILPFDGSYLEHVDETRKSNPDVVKKAVASNPKALSFADDELRSDAEFVQELVQQNGSTLKYAQAVVKKEKGVVLAAVQCGGFNLKFAGDQMKKNPEVVTIAVQHHGMALRDAADNVRQDRAVVRSALMQNGAALQYAEEALRDDKELVMVAVNNTGQALQFASDRLKEDPEVALAAVTNDGRALRYAGKEDEPRTDAAIVNAALKSDPAALQFAALPFRQDKALVTDLVQRSPLVLQFASKKLRKDRDLVMLAALTHKRHIYITAASQCLVDLWQISDIRTWEDWFTCFTLNMVWGDHFGGLGRKSGVDYDSHSDDTDEEEEEEEEEGVGGVEEMAELPPEKQTKAREAYMKTCTLLAQAMRDIETIADCQYKPLVAEVLGFPDGVSAIVDMLDSLRKDQRFNKTWSFDELVKHSLERDGRVLEFASSSTRKNPVYVRQAIASSGSVLKFADREFRRDPAMCQQAVESDPMALEHVDASQMSSKVYAQIVSAAVSKDGLALRAVDQQHLHSLRDAVLCAVRNNGMALEHASKLREDREVVEAALQQNPAAVEFVRNQADLHALAGSSMQEREVLDAKQLRDMQSLKLAAKKDLAAVVLSDVDVADQTLVEAIGENRGFHFEFLPGSNFAVTSSAVIDRDARTVDFRNTCSVVCPNLTVVRGCRFYYEIEIVEMRDDAFTQFGFADHGFSPPDNTDNQGVGDDENSWAVDGCAQGAWHDGDPQEWPDDDDVEEDDGEDSSLGSMPDDDDEDEDKDDDDDDDDKDDDDAKGEDDVEISPAPKANARGDGAQFVVGDRVKGKYRNGVWYGATIAGVEGDKFVLKWDDGDTADTLKGPNDLQQLFKVGDKVNGRCKDGTYRAAKIVRKEGFSFAVAWEDGGTQDTVKAPTDLREVVEQKESESEDESEGWGWSSSDNQEDENDDDDNDDDDEEEDEDDDEDEDEEDDKPQATTKEDEDDDDEEEEKDDKEGKDDDDDDDDDDDASEDRDAEEAEKIEEWNAWRAGDVIGFACDPLAGTIAVTVNGQYWHGGQCQDPLLSHENVMFVGPGLYPALTGNNIKVRYNFGEAVDERGPFQFLHTPPPGTNVHEWLFRPNGSPPFQLRRGGARGQSSVSASANGFQAPSGFEGPAGLSLSDLQANA